MFEIEMLPAKEGDCLWIRYGAASAPSQILIDGGRSATFTKSLRPRLLALPAAKRRFELLIVTHVDRDHIEGALALLEDPVLRDCFGEVWFNGYDHLKGVKLETFGAVQGERLTAALLPQKARWNALWNGKAVAIRGATPPLKKLPGGMTLTLLSPDRDKLESLIPDWEKECRDAGILPGSRARRQGPAGLEHFGAIDVEALAATPFEQDTSPANGSSIGILAEFQGRRALLAGDAHPDRLLSSLRALPGGKQRIAIDLFKITHHGSEANISQALLQAVECPRYLISTNGSYFKHPKSAAMARILKFGGKRKTIAFNYRSKFTEIWDQPALRANYGYETIYPASKSNGSLVVAM